MDVVRKDWAVRLEVQNQLNKYHIDLNGAEKIKQHVKDLKHKRRLRTANAINQKNFVSFNKQLNNERKIQSPVNLLDKRDTVLEQKRKFKLF